MKNVILSADGDLNVYAVPDAVADNLKKYCIKFCDHWLWNSPHAKKYRRGIGVCYNEADFIAYLNEWVFPNEPSVLVENLGFPEKGEQLPEKYRDCPAFYF